MKILNCLLLILFVGLLVYFGINFSLIIILILLSAFLIFRRKKGSFKSNKQLPNLTKVKENHYKKIGMSNTEIIFFRDTMNIAKEQIMKLQENMTTSAKLRAIDLRNDTVKISKALFKELVKEPKKLHLANHFLYTHLPNLVELTNKYLEINTHELKTKQTYEKLEETSQIIDQVSKLISSDYEQFVADDLEELDIELTVAKNSLNRDNKIKEEN